jgi:Flp pilus assembly protein TadD
MREANVYATREDVAAFMTHLMGGARATRTKDIENAVRESRSRVRVEVAKPQLASEAMFAPRPVALEEERRVLVSHSASRPSRQPTAFVSAQPEERRVLESHSAGMSRPSRQPTAFVPAQPSVNRAEIAPPVARPSRFRMGVPRRVVGWIAAACLFGVLLVCAVPWRAARHSRPIGAGTAMAVPPAGAQGPLGPLGLAPGSTPVVSDTAATPTLPSSVAAPATAHARDHHAAVTLLTEPAVADRGSADDLLARARAARRAGRLADAALLFGAAIEKAPSDSEALEGLAEVDEARGESAKAIGTYRRALAANPRYLPARLGLADALWTSGQRDEARAFYRSIVDEVPAAMCPDVARERAAGKG